MDNNVRVSIAIILIGFSIAAYILASGGFFAPTEPTSDQQMYSYIVLNDIDPAVVRELCNKTYFIETNGTTEPNSAIFVYVYPRVARPLNPEGYLFGAGGVLHNSTEDSNDPLCLETYDLYDYWGKWQMKITTCGLFANETRCSGAGGQAVACPVPVNFLTCAKLLAGNSS